MSLFDHLLRRPVAVLGGLLVIAAIAACLTDLPSVLAHRPKPTLQRPAPKAKLVPAVLPPSGPPVYAIEANGTDKVIEVKPLDYALNPYRNHYSDVDRWIYAHAWSQDEVKAWRGGKHHDMFMAALVDPDGWLRPVGDPGPDGLLNTYQLAEYSLQDRELAEQQQRTAKQANTGIWVYADPGDAALMDEYTLRARLQPLDTTAPIPAWLAAQPPRIAVVVPNGEVVTYGPLGEPPPPQPTSPIRTEPPQSPGWYRYSARGELIETNTTWNSNPTSWVNFYWRDAQTKTADAAPDSKYQPQRRSGNYWVKLAAPTAADAENEQNAVRPPVAAFSYNGTPLDLTKPVPAELLAERMFIGKNAVRDAYLAQQKYGVWLGHSGEQAGAETKSE